MSSRSQIQPHNLSITPHRHILQKIIILQNRGKYQCFPAAGWFGGKSTSDQNLLTPLQLQTLGFCVNQRAVTQDTRGNKEGRSRPHKQLHQLKGCSQSHSRAVPCIKGDVLVRENYQQQEHPRLLCSEHSPFYT